MLVVATDIGAVNCRKISGYVKAWMCLNPRGQLIIDHVHCVILVFDFLFQSVALSYQHYMV